MIKSKRKLKQTFDTLKERKNIDKEVKEYGITFYENTYKKAKTIYNLTKETTIADDSGLCITSLNDFPSVLTSGF